jgi:hypothetical protein
MITKDIGQAFDITLANCLPNGAPILRRSCSLGRWIVLTVWKGQYVTWCVDEDGSAYWGHYFQDSFWADVDFAERITRPG